MAMLNNINNKVLNILIGFIIILINDNIQILIWFFGYIRSVNGASGAVNKVRYIYPPKGLK